MEKTRIKPKKRRYGFVTPFKDTINKNSVSSGPTVSATIAHRVTMSDDKTPNKLNKLADHSSNEVTLEGKLTSVTATPRPKHCRQFNHRYKSPVLLSNTNPSPENYDSKTELKKLKDELEKLRSVAYHKKHNDLATLTSLTEKWQDAAHQALHEIQTKLTSETKPPIDMILQGLNLYNQAALIGCDCEDGSPHNAPIASHNGQ